MDAIAVVQIQRLEYVGLTPRVLGTGRDSSQLGRSDTRESHQPGSQRMSFFRERLIVAGVPNSLARKR